MTARIGFMGTRVGASAAQLAWLTDHLTARHTAGAEFHHGDCVGADAQAHDIAQALGYLTVAHPPADPRLRAWCPADVIHDPAPYLERDARIVDTTDLLLALPDGPERDTRHAQATGRPYEMRLP